MTNKVKAFLGLLFLFPLTVNAHVQWFVTPEEMKNVDLPFDITTLLLSLMVGLCVISSIILSRTKISFLPFQHLVSKKIKIQKELYLSYFSLLMATFFILLLLKGGFLAPNLILPQTWVEIGLLIQAVLVIAATFSTSLSGGVLIILSIITMIAFPFKLYINYIFEFLSIGLFMLLTGSNNTAIDHWIMSRLSLDNEKAWRLAITILRVGIGAQLAILALTEKLINPGLALVFIERFPFYNFFPALGWSAVTDLHFVYFIGISELVLGIILMLGVANRLVMLALTAAFIATAIIHGVHEVEGHLPIFASALILLLECRNVFSNKFSFLRTS
ncbi:hypothetical protein [Aeromonas veronii]|uniref:hypothetical protein n=1 Tax=Aeromonas veronii TaxID=654 RepID=UPI003B9F7E29